MSCDVFSRHTALQLLHNKQVWFFGDSNTRSLYKDLVWLLEHGSLVPQQSLQTKNELTHANDYKTSNSPTTSGRDYEETREYYNASVMVKFTFLTKMWSESLTRAFKRGCPDVVVINSCVWDLSRWGPNGISEYKINLIKTMEFFKKTLPKNCLTIFTTTLPLSSDSKGGFLRKQIEFLRFMLPWHVIEANNFLGEIARLYKYDVLDLHYNTRFLREEWMPDGIHWTPMAYRWLTNILLTHLALSTKHPLPGIFELADEFIQNSQVHFDNNNNSKGEETNERTACPVNNKNNVKKRKKVEVDYLHVVAKKQRTDDKQSTVAGNAELIDNNAENIFVAQQIKFDCPDKQLLITNNTESDLTQLFDNKELPVPVTKFVDNQAQFSVDSKKQLLVTNNNKFVSNNTKFVDNNGQLFVTDNKSVLNNTKFIDSNEQLSFANNTEFDFPKAVDKVQLFVTDDNQTVLDNTKFVDKTQLFITDTSEFIIVADDNKKLPVAVVDNDKQVSVVAVSAETHSLFLNETELPERNQLDLSKDEFTFTSFIESFAPHPSPPLK